MEVDVFVLTVDVPGVMVDVEGVLLVECCGMPEVCKGALVMARKLIAATATTAATPRAMVVLPIALCCDIIQWTALNGSV
ncbi:MAG: hypothetical protein JRN08_03055 [Nitrososphaerota archaeon]|nr:hypothetical protein [Nitrososphaerota archaeon]